jgi:hypothetical protein
MRTEPLRYSRYALAAAALLLAVTPVLWVTFSHELGVASVAGAVMLLVVCRRLVVRHRRVRRRVRARARMMAGGAR